MKMKRGLIFVAACLLCCNAFASLGGERDKYRTMYVPYNNGNAVPFVARDSSAAGYTPLTVCGKPSYNDFAVTGLRLKNEYYWQSKNETGSLIDHYKCQSLFCSSTA